jgi:hypothetical protein
VLVVVGEVVGDARDARVHVAAAERLVIDLLPDGGFDERWAGEIDRPLFLDDDRLVAHRRHVSAARRARPHHHRNLRDAARRELRLVIENPPKVIAVGEHLILQRQESAAGIHEVDARKAVLERDFLRTQVLLDGQRVVSAAFYGRIVRENHAADASNGSDSADEPCSRQRHVIDAVRSELADLEPGRSGVEQLRDARACRQLAPLEMPRARFLGAPGVDLVERTA